jgi:NAD-dependent dihydropyrimidine dehydrogenase PreA subunit
VLLILAMKLRGARSAPLNFIAGLSNAQLPRRCRPVSAVHQRISASALRLRSYSFELRTRGFENTMPHTIVTNTCEGVADCVDACPVACIHEGPSKNTKGTDWYWIDFSTCIDCGICLQVCPVEGAILPEERPELQNTPS